jgi:pimeloyl-ACP methyl ester carboxylesterase
MTKKAAALALVTLLVVLAVLPSIRSAESQDLAAGARTHAPGRFVALSDGQVHYDVAGPEDGQPVVLVHGFSVPSYTWDRTARALADSGFRVVRYDLYGRGYSDRPEVTYDRALFVNQLRELLDSLRISWPVDVVGLSMGGAITAAFAADHPERVRRLAFLAPLNAPAQIGPLARPFVGEYLNRVYLVPSLAESQLDDFSAPERFPDWPERYREQMRYRGFGAAILSTLRHFAARDPLPDFQAVGRQGRPALLVWGDEDRVLPFAESERVRAALGGAEFVPVPGAGHALHYEHSERIGPVLVDFLRRP